MQFTRACAGWCVLVAFGWTTTLLASADVARGTAHNWWWVFMGSSAFANLMCVMTATLVLWRLAAPAGHVWQIAERVGYERGRADGAAEAQAKVIPMPRRSLN